MTQFDVLGFLDVLSKVSMLVSVLAVVITVPALNKWIVGFFKRGILHSRDRG